VYCFHDFPSQKKKKPFEMELGFLEACHSFVRLSIMAVGSEDDSMLEITFLLRHSSRIY
jgi:hypothetical protein